ncbi:MAG: cyclase family protein [Armatimonadetes bacterium]|nr:cyclase family protein [Armatimonadota bacterium]
MPRTLDITGPIYEGMWTYGLPYAPFRMEEVPPVDWVAYPTYSWNISMSVQTGTYLETGAHMFPGMRTIDRLAPEDLFLAARVMTLSPKRPGEMITGEEIGALADDIPEGAAVLICAGWGANWESPGFLADSPRFSADAMDRILSLRPALVGADLPRWDSLEHPQGFFERFFRQDVLLLAPLVNLERWGSRAGRLIVFPLPIRGACASPARAVLVST